MNNKISWAILFGMITATFAGYYFVVSEQSAAKIGNSQTHKIYTHSTLGFSFVYRVHPDGYILEERESTPGNDHIASIGLIRKEDHESLLRGEREGGEGPPTIEIRAVRNTKGQALLEWLEANPSLSNFQLLIGETGRKNVAEKQAIFYQADGLYMSRNVALEHGGVIYLISGAFMDRESQIYRDYDEIVRSFTLDAITSAETIFGFIRGVDEQKGMIRIEFDEARWLDGKEGEDAAIAAGLCTESTRNECLPNDYFIQNISEETMSIPLAQNASIFMRTWRMEETGSVTQRKISVDEFTKLIRNTSAHWNTLPYTITVENGSVTEIKEVYVP